MPSAKVTLQLSSNHSSSKIEFSMHPNSLFWSVILKPYGLSLKHVQFVLIKLCDVIAQQRRSKEHASSHSHGSSIPLALWPFSHLHFCKAIALHRPAPRASDPTLGPPGRVALRGEVQDTALGGEAIELRGGLQTWPRGHRWKWSPGARA